MARYTKDFKKELRQIGGKFKWVELTTSEQGIARERTRLAKVENGGRGAPRKPASVGSTPGVGNVDNRERKWFAGKAETKTGSVPGAVENGGRGSAQTGSAPGGKTEAPAGSAGTETERKDRRDAAQAPPVFLAGDHARVDVSQLAEHLVGAHEILALVARNQIWRINIDQAKSLAKAIDAIAQQYRLPINPKTLAWVQLVSCAGMIYGPKLMLVAALPKKANGGAPPKMPDAGPAGMDILNATTHFHGNGNKH